MPISAALAALLGSMIQGGGNAAQNLSNRGQARQQQQWNLEQWGRENKRQDFNWNRQNKFNQGIWNQQNTYNEGRWNTENEYNQSVWHQQNKYNSPQQQMARLTEAGLNPHLIYGKGSSGPAGAVATSNMRGDQIQKNQLNTPDIKGYSRPEMQSVTRGMTAFRDQIEFKNIQAQTDNVEQMTDTGAADEQLKKQQAGLALLNTDIGKLNLRKSKELYDTSVDAAIWGLKHAQAKTQEAQANASVATGTKFSRIQESAQRLANLKKQGNLIKYESQLKQEELKLRKVGLTSQDHLLFRSLIKFFTSDYMPKISMSPSKNAMTR